MKRTPTKDQIFMGQEFNRLTVLEPAFYKNMYNRKVWFVKVKCSCGKIFETRAQALLSKLTTSCGCLRIEKHIASNKNRAKYNKEHTDHPLWISWRNMRQLNKNNCCNDWSNYELFYTWAIPLWKEGLCLTRTDNKLPYSSDNCIFKTLEEIVSVSDKNFDKAKATNMKRYNAECVLANKDIRAKCDKTINEKYNSKEEMYRLSAEKAKNTSMDMFGVEHYSKTQQYKDNYKKTCMERYNVEYPAVLESTKEKSRATWMKNLGYSHPSKSPVIKAKKIANCIKLYGVESIWMIPEKRAEILAKSVNTTMHKFGVPTYTQFTGYEQQTLQDFVESITNKDFYTTRQILNGREIDIYNDELKFGIEYCGLKWHTESKRGTSSHYSKFIECSKQNIQLLTIFSDEWLRRREQVEYHILRELEITRYVNKDELRIVRPSPEMSRRFMNKNCIKYTQKLPIYSIGLAYKEHLVQVMSLTDEQKGLIFRSEHFQDWRVIGGDEILLNIVYSWAKRKGYNNIMGYSDNRLSIGHEFDVLGFCQNKEISPIYRLVNINNPKIRFSKNNSNADGYDKVWDCGYMKWILNF